MPAALLCAQLTDQELVDPQKVPSKGLVVRIDLADRSLCRDGRHARESSDR